MKVGGAYPGLAVCVAMLVGLVGGSPAATPAGEDRPLQQREEPNKDNEALVSHNDRDEKVFIVLAQIQPTECTTRNATITRGTCLTSTDCSSGGGTSSGTCASGLGTCCIINKTCNSASSRNNTFFVSPSGGSDDGTAACTLTINRVSDNICQMRLDFLSMELSQPSKDGKCTDDFLTVSSGVSPTLMICGSNTGQHIYYDLDPSGGAVKLTVDRAASVVMDRHWIIKVAQIACDSPYRAPVGCLQYHTRTTGTVSSFNFAGAKVNNPAPLTRQLSSMDYAICIRRADSYCGITWEPIKNERFSFSVSNAADAIDIDVLGTIDSLTTHDECKSDFVVIPGGEFSEANSKAARMADRYCGLGFPAAVTTTFQPFILYVKTDHNEGQDRGNRGFKFTYRQIKTCD